MTTRVAFSRRTSLISSSTTSSIDRSEPRLSTSPTWPLSIRSTSTRLRARFGCCSKAAMTPVSPQRAPSARKVAARMLLPEPEGPATSTE